MSWLFLQVLFAITLQKAALGEDIECFAAGECTESLYVNQWSAADAQECLEFCQDYASCQFFTHYGAGQDLCLGLANCDDFEDSTCIDCYSGNVTCPDLQCWLPGSSVGNTISVGVASGEEECLTACRGAYGCNWITFDEIDGGCVLLEGCFNLGGNGCDTCWSSQVQCGERKDLTKILVIGGTAESYLANVETVDLSTEELNCDPVANYPFRVENSVGTVLDGLPTVCGGYKADLDEHTDECYQYLYEENRWTLMNPSMLEGRRFHQASMINSATWLITGGVDNDFNELDTTEIWQDGEFQPGPLLPFPLAEHCQVTLDPTHVAILGGYNGTDYPNQFFLLDLENEVWISMPAVPATLSNDACGLIENSVNGFELVVLARYYDCHIFNFKDMTWRQGPEVPFDVDISIGEMHIQMEKTFDILGGHLEDEPLTDAIFTFDNENYLWHKKTATLEVARRDGVAIAVPDEMVNCN